MASAKRPNAERRPRRLLFVEDDDLVAAGVTSLLEMEGFTVQTLGQGLAVVDAIKTFEPDAVILDVTLPDISGVEVFRSVRRRWPDLPVLFSTGYGTDSGPAAELKGNAVEILQKPYEIADLLSALRRLAGS